MSASAVELFLLRIKIEEGVRTDCYDDATGKTVTAPVGNLTWGYGFYLHALGTMPGLFDCIARFILVQLDKELSQYGWYLGCSPVRQSVLMDIAYNAGVAGLLKFPHMLAACSAQDWSTAAVECRVSDARLNQTRYAPLRTLLLSNGVNST